MLCQIERSEDWYTDRLSSLHKATQLATKPGIEARLAALQNAIKGLGVSWNMKDINHQEDKDN